VATEAGRGTLKCLRTDINARSGHMELRSVGKAKRAHQMLAIGGHGRESAPVPYPTDGNPLWSFLGPPGPLGDYSGPPRPLGRQSRGSGGDECVTTIA